VLIATIGLEKWRLVWYDGSIEGFGPGEGLGFVVDGDRTGKITTQQPIVASAS